jgi:hypothetical protein
MLKTSGHVKKHYRACCTIFDAFNTRRGVNVTFEDFLVEIERWAVKIQDPDEQNVFRGDMLEILAEMFFGAFANDPAVGLTGYTPVPLPEDYGVDGTGNNAAGTDCAVQVKYRGDPTDLVTYAEIARTFTSAVLQLGLPLYNGSDNIFIFTSAYDVTVACKTVMGNKIHILSRGIIKNKIDNNVSFWDYAYNEIYNLFSQGGSLCHTQVSQP